MTRSFGSRYGYGTGPRQKTKSPIGWILIIIAGVLAWQHHHGDWPFDGSFGIDGGDRIVDPTDPDDGQSDSLLSDAFVVFIFESNEKTEQQEIILRGADDFIAARGMAGKRIYDDDQSAAIPFLEFGESKNVSPPMIAIVKDRTITHAAPFPDSYDELDKIIR